MQLRRLMIVLAICIVGLVVAAFGMYKWGPIRHIKLSRALYDGGWNQHNSYIRS